MSALALPVLISSTLLSCSPRLTKHAPDGVCFHLANESNL
jgi:hypothetical protein